MLQKAIDVMDEILAARLEVDPSDLEHDWNKVVLLHFQRSGQTLAGTRYWGFVGCTTLLWFYVGTFLNWGSTSGT